MRLSRTLAVVLGILVPIAETVRRWNTWRQSLALFDDYILAALVLYGAWLAGRDFRRGQRFLAAAWGIACGVGYGSFFGQLDRLQRGEPDPAPIPSIWVAVIKGVLFALSILALTATLRAKPQAKALDGVVAEPASEPSGGPVKAQHNLAVGDGPPSVS